MMDCGSSSSSSSKKRHREQEAQKKEKETGDQGRILLLTAFKGGSSSTSPVCWAAAPAAPPPGLLRHPTAGYGGPLPGGSAASPKPVPSSPVSSLVTPGRVAASEAPPPGLLHRPPNVSPGPRLGASLLSPAVPRRLWRRSWALCQAAGSGGEGAWGKQEPAARAALLQTWQQGQKGAHRIPA